MNSVSHLGFVDKPLTFHVTLHGKALAAWARDATPAQRALTALALAEGASVLVPTRAQAAVLVGASPYAVAIAALATPEEAGALYFGGISMAEVRQAHARTPNTLTDADINAFIERAGIERVFTAIDNKTAPTPNSALAAA
jgi:hypothetical protein